MKEGPPQFELPELGFSSFELTHIRSQKPEYKPTFRATTANQTYDLVQKLPPVRESATNCTDLVPRNRNPCDASVSTDLSHIQRDAGIQVSAKGKSPCTLVCTHSPLRSIPTPVSQPVSSLSPRHSIYKPNTEVPMTTMYDSRATNVDPAALLRFLGSVGPVVEAALTENIRHVRTFSCTYAYTHTHASKSRPPLSDSLNVIININA